METKAVEGVPEPGKKLHLQSDEASDTSEEDTHVEGDSLAGDMIDEGGKRASHVASLVRFNFSFFF